MILKFTKKCFLRLFYDGLYEKLGEIAINLSNDVPNGMKISCKQKMQ